MKKILLPTFIVIIIGFLVRGFILNKWNSGNDRNIKTYSKWGDDENEEEEDDEAKAIFTKERARYEYNLLKDVSNGKIPYGIHEKELAIARTLPLRQTSLSGILGIDNLNTYQPAGPTNIGGRTRAIIYDRRFNNTSNRVIIAGCVSGGILRSSDAGSTWTRVSPENDIHTLTALTQDPRPGFENTWYAGGGEPYSSSADAPGASLPGSRCVEIYR